MKYYAKWLDREFQIDLDDSSQPPNVMIDGEQVAVELIKVDDSGAYSMLLNNSSYQVFVEKKENTYSVSIGNEKHVIELENEKSRFVRRFIKTDKNKSGIVEIKSPMPGLIVKIMVSEGRKIAENESLLIIEAMKMENEIRSPSGGIVEKILCKEGTSVDKDAVLIVIDGTVAPETR